MMGQGKPDIDRLATGTLRYPMLNALMGSQVMKANMVAVASEIRRGWMSRVPRDTGRLASSAQVSAHRSTSFPDRRWEADLTIGGPDAPYARAVEEEVHALADTLAAMGYRP